MGRIGVASMPGNHMMLRGYADVEERAMFERYFKKLSAEERASMYAARRRHKTTSLLLHELAHNLGAPHSVVADTLMYPIYSDRSAELDPIFVRFALLAVRRRPRPSSCSRQRPLNSEGGAISPATCTSARCNERGAPRNRVLSPPHSLHPPGSPTQLAKAARRSTFSRRHSRRLLRAGPTLTAHA